jgi:hypothetical protein
MKYRSLPFTFEEVAPAASVAARRPSLFVPAIVAVSVFVALATFLAA